MKILIGLLALPLLTNSLFAQAAVAQKEYILAKKSPPLPSGEKFKAVKNMTMPDAKIGIALAGQNVQGTMSSSNQEEATYDFVSQDQIKVTFDKNRSLEKTNMMGREKNEEEVHPSEGKTIVLNKTDDKWVGKLSEGTIEEADQAAFEKTVKGLEKSLNQKTDARIYGTEPRKVGDSWEVDPSLMPGMGEFDINGGKMKMTFLEVKDYEGESCAILKTTFTINGKMTEDHMKGMDMTLEGSGRTVRSLKYFTDLKFSGEMKMNMAGEFEAQPGMNAKMTMNSSMKIDMLTSKIEAAKKK